MIALLRLVRRLVLHRPWQPLLAALAVALGVAVVVGVDAANASASRAFDQTVDSLVGRATHRIVGGPAGLPDQLLVELRVDRGLRSASPTVEGTARHVLDGQRDRTLRILGIDPFTEGPLRPWLAFRADGDGNGLPEIGPLMTRPGAVAAVPQTVATLGRAVGERFEIEVAGVRREVELVDTLQPRDQLAQSGLQDVLVCDLATAQELLGEIGRLDRIDLQLSDAEAVDLRADLATGLRLESASADRGTLDELTRAFRQNLTALSLLSLLVGAFLVHNAMQLAVVRRRALLGLLRALGASRRQIFAAVLCEAAVLSLFGTLAGLALGLLLARALLGVVGGTIRELYATVQVDTVQVDPWTLSLAAALGVVVGLAAAFAPAWEATSVAPRMAMLRSGLEGRARSFAGRAAWIGAALVVLGFVLGQAADDGGMALAYASVLAVLLGATLLAPTGTVLLLRLSRAPLSRWFGSPGRHAVRSAETGLSRTAVATAALMLAVSATVGLGVMIQSFRSTVATWLDSTLGADVYVSVPQSMATRLESRLTPAATDAILGVDGVAAHSTYRRIESDLLAPRPGRGAAVIELAAVSVAPATTDTLRFVAGNAAAARAVLDGDRDGLLVSEPLAARLDVGPGDVLRIATDHGPARFEIAATFRDYASERGYAMLSRSLYDRYWDDPSISSIALWASAGVDADTLTERIRSALAAQPQEVLARSNRTLRETSLEVFDRTFAVTAVLRVLCAIVAFVGVLGALASLQLERRREAAVFRALGAVPAQIARSVFLQNGLLGLCAGLLSIPTGIALGWLLVNVVHRHSFGWTLLDFQAPPRVLLEAVVLSTSAALLAAWWPARTLSRTPVARGLREE